MSLDHHDWRDHGVQVIKAGTLVRSNNEAVVINLDIDAVEKPEAVAWIDPIHKG